MEPVRVLCPNCRGKLVVRSEFLLGQTIICPRCKSNVLLPSSASQATTTGVISPVQYDSTAITRVDDGQLAQQLNDEPTGLGSLLDADDQTFESAIEAFRPLRGTIDDSNLPSPPISGHVIESTVAVEGFGSIQHDNPIAISRVKGLNNPATKKFRQILIIAMTGIVATLVALGGLVAFLNYSSKPTSIAKIPTQPESIQTEPVNSSIEQTPSPETKSMEADPKLNGSETSPPTNESQANVVPTVIPPASLEMPNIATNDENITPPKPENNANSATIDAKPSINTKETTLKPESVVVETPDIPEAMKRLNVMFAPGSMSMMADAFGDGKPTDGSEAGPEKVDIEALYHPDAVTNPNWDLVQTVRLQRLSTKKPIPFNKVLISLGQLSGAAIGWDFEALRFSGFDVEQPIEYSIESTSIGDFVKTLCDKYHLEIIVDNEGLPLLRPNSEEIVSRLPSDWSIGDLSSDNASVTAWQELLTKFFPDAREQWQIQGTEIQWSETASPIQRANVAAFLDQARIAVGLAPKSKLPSAVTDPRLGLDASLELLTKPGTRIREHTIALPESLDLAARDVGLKLLFDWKNISTHGLSHSKSTTSLFRGRTWVEIAKWGLDEFSLVAVVDGSDQIVLSTLQQQRRMLRTMLLKLDEGKKIESLRESLRTLSPADAQGLSMLLVSPLPPASERSGTWVAIRICPPNTFQLQTRAVRDAFRLPALARKPLK